MNLSKQRALNDKAEQILNAAARKLAREIRALPVHQKLQLMEWLVKEKMRKKISRMNLCPSCQAKAENYEQLLYPAADVAAFQALPCTCERMR